MKAEISLQKVVVRTRDGEVLRGFAKQEPIKDMLRILTPEGKEQSFSTEQLKGVFFVKDFEGDPRYSEIKFLNKQEVSPRMWVRVEFFDGEVLEGQILNDVEMLLSNGFYLWPSDKDTNNLCVYIFKSSLTAFTVLAPSH